MKRFAHLVPLIATLAALAGCASSYQAPVIERPVARPGAKPSPGAAQPTADTYTVKRGDTLYSIALDNGLDYRDLAAWNNLADPAAIRPGSVLVLRGPQAVAPPPEAIAQTGQPAGVQVQPVLTPGPVEARPLGGPQRPAAAVPSTGEPPRAPVEVTKTEPKAAKLPYSEENVAMLSRRSPLPPSSPLTLPPTPGSPPPAAPPVQSEGPDSVAWMWPASGKVLAGFSEATNKGVDIMGKVGDPVVASASGRVVYSGTGLRGYGKLVIIKHNETYLSAYAHNSNLLVKEGQNVVRGQKIAEIGSSDANQAKLHFEIRRLGKPVDPLRFLPDRPS